MAVYKKPAAKRKIFWLNCFIIVVIALNLRAPITSIGPIIDVIREYYGLNSAIAGILTSLPLIAFGLVSFMVAYFAPIRALMVGILLIVCGEILRSFGGAIGLYVGMALLGSGIAIANVLLPSFVKEKFPRQIPQIMGVYNLVLNVSAISGIALALPLLSFLSLEQSLAFWLLFACVAFVAYFPYIRNGRIWRIKTQSIKTISLATHPTSWKLTLFMGLQSFMAYSAFTWLAAIVAEKGYGMEFGAHILLISQLVAAPFGLLGPLWLGRMRNAYKQPYMATLCLCYVLAYSILFVSDTKIAIYCSAVLVGIPMGGVFGIALLFIPLKSNNALIATKLSSMMQGFGYLIAACAPFIIGFLHDYFGRFDEAIALLILSGCAVSIVGLLAYRAKIIGAI